MESFSEPQLAQTDIACPGAPPDSPLPGDFAEALDPVNAVAGGADGYVWRLQSGSGDATDFSAFGNEWPIASPPVRRDVGALTALLHAGRHREPLKRRHEWFERPTRR